MKTLHDCIEMGAGKRAQALKDTAAKAKSGVRILAKLLLAAEQKGDFKAGEMNAFAQKVTGLELRREVQGTYEAVNVLRKVQNETLPLTEAQFDTILTFAILVIASFLKGDPDRAIEACEIAVSGVDVVKRLKELRQEAQAEKAAAKAGAGSGDGDEAPEVQTPPAATGPDLEALAKFIASLGDAPLISFEPLRARLAEDVNEATTVECTRRYAEYFHSLAGLADARRDELSSTELKAA